MFFSEARTTKYSAPQGSTLELLVFSYMNTMLFNRYQKLPLICMQMTLEDVQKIGNDLKVEI